jgi:hypothetical protein
MGEEAHTIYKIFIISNGLVGIRFGKRSLGVFGRIILKRIFKKWGGDIGTALIWLRIEG